MWHNGDVSHCSLLNVFVSELQLELNSKCILKKYKSVCWSSYHEDAPVAVSVDAPQFKISLGLDGGSSGSPIDQGQLSKTTSFSDTGHPLPVHIHLQTEQKTKWWRVSIRLNASEESKSLHGRPWRIPFFSCHFNFSTHPETPSPTLLSLSPLPASLSSVSGLFDMLARLVPKHLIPTKPSNETL